MCRVRSAICVQSLSSSLVYVLMVYYICTNRTLTDSDSTQY